MSVFPALVMLATVCPSAPVPKAKAKLYFPTTVGSKSVYVSDDASINKVSTHTETVTKVEVKGGTRRVTVEYTLDAKHVHTSVYQVTADGVTPTQGYRSRWFNLSLKADDSWEEDVDIGHGKERVVYIRGSEEDVEVSAGKFRAVRVDKVWERPKFRQTIRMTYWVAPGVGLVKSTANSGGGPKDVITTELTSFTPGK